MILEQDESPLRLLSWDEVNALPLIEPKFYLEHYIPQEGIVLLYGKFGTYKTPLTVALAKAIATGSEFMGLAAERAAPVLYVEMDSPERVVLPRIQAAGIELKGVEVDFLFPYPGFDVVHPASSTHNAKIYAFLAKAHKEKQYKVVFIDALRGIHSLTAEASETPHQVYRAISLLFPGAVLILIHHDRKTTYERGMSEETQKEMAVESFSGSQAWINHATVALKLSHYDKKKKQVLLSHVKSQASELQPSVILKVTGGVHFSSASEITASGLEAMFLTLPSDCTAAEKDTAIAEYFGVSTRTAQRKRLAHEALLRSR